jgi:hypothetical protein
LRGTGSADRPSFSVDLSDAWRRRIATDAAELTALPSSNSDEGVAGVDEKEGVWLPPRRGVAPAPVRGVAPTRGVAPEREGVRAGVLILGVCMFKLMQNNW